VGGELGKGKQIPNRTSDARFGMTTLKISEAARKGSYGIVDAPDVQKQRKLNGDGGEGGADEGWT